MSIADLPSGNQRSTLTTVLPLSNARGQHVRNLLDRRARAMNAFMDTVIDDIYQAAFDAASFKTMFQRICAMLDAPQGCIMVLGAGSAISYIHNINPDSQQNYNTAYLGEDPWYQQATYSRALAISCVKSLQPIILLEHSGNRSTTT